MAALYQMSYSPGNNEFTKIMTGAFSQPPSTGSKCTVTRFTSGHLRCVAFSIRVDASWTASTDSFGSASQCMTIDSPSSSGSMWPCGSPKHQGSPNG